MKIAIGMETRKRPQGVDYYEQTIANARRAGVFASPHLSSFTVSESNTLTRQQNGQRAISLAAKSAKNASADFVLKLEDDLDFTNSFLENVCDWMEDHKDLPGMVMWSLGSTFETVSASKFEQGCTTIFEPGVSFPVVRDALSQGVKGLAQSTAGYWGAQALLWRTEDALELAEWLGDDPVYGDSLGNLHRGRGHDLLIAHWVLEVKKCPFVIVAIPSLVQHVGEQSNLDRPELNHRQPFFQFPFGGRDFRYVRKGA